MNEMNTIFLQNVNKYFKGNEFKLWAYLYLYYCKYNKPYYRKDNNLEKALGKSKGSVTRTLNECVNKNYIWVHPYKNLIGYSPNYSLFRKMIKEE